MSDLISRKDAIEALCQAGCGSGHCGVSCDDVKAIEQLPSAQPERKKGHWIDEETNYSCSECHRGCWVNSDYCPWCGARMMKGEEG